MTSSSPAPPPPTDQVRRLGGALSAAARTADDLDCLEVFAELLSLETDGGRPHLLTVLLEPDGRAQIVTIGHACPGLTFQLSTDFSIDLVQLWFNETEGRPDSWPARPQ